MSGKIRTLVKYFALVSQLGLQFVITVLVGGFIGHKLDLWLGGGGFFTIAGILLGILGGFWGAYKLIMEAEKNKQ